MIMRLNYYWRVVATGGCFALFGLGGIALWTFVFPMIRALPGRAKAERIRWVIHCAFRVFLWFMQTVGIMRLKVEGAERLREANGMLVVANHPTLIDVVALISLMPDASCVVKQKLWKNPCLGGVVRAAGYISNSDSDRLMSVCAQDLRRGWPMIIFPEGTRSRAGQPLEFLRGAAYIALRSRRPVLPVLIDCSPSTLTKREKWYQIPRRPFCLRIKVLEPRSVESLADVGQAQTIVARRLTEALETLFTRELALWKN